MIILSTHEQLVSYWFGYFFFLIASVGLLFVLYLLLTQAFAEKDFPKGVFSMVVGFLFLLTSTHWYLGYFDDEPTTKYRVQVYDMSELYRQGFKIIDQDGDIFTVRKDR